MWGGVLTEGGLLPKWSKPDSLSLGKRLDSMFKYGQRSQMRVAGGTAKGRRLKGTISPEARPTTARVRGAIFNILSLQLYQAGKVLDLYAGSGSLGIEALSRGARSADFVEQDRRQCGVIRENLENTGFRECADIICGSVDSVLARLVGPYQLVLLDPPYRLQNLDQILEEIASVPNLVEDGGVVVAGHSSRQTLLPAYGSLRLMSQRRYGDNAVDFYRNEAKEN